MFFLSADLIDDAQDGDLPAEIAWPEAVNAGNALLFAAISAFSAAAPAAEVGLEVAEAGRALTWGQAMDLASSWEAPMTEEEVLLSVRRKSGASCRLYARMAALSSGLSSEIVDLWGSVGESWGTMIQLRSDVEDLRETLSRDLRQRKATLPIAFALARDPKGTRTVLESGNRTALLNTLQASGALMYADFTIDALIHEIEGALRQLPLSDDDFEGLVKLSQSAAAPALL